MGKWYEWKLKIVSIGILAQGAYGWVESYDGGEDDEKVIKIMLPMIAIAVLACVLGYYIKNKFFKNDEKDEEDKEINEKSIAGMGFPAPKANKPWLNMASQGPQSKAQLGPPGYEYTLPGYQQATDKRTNSRNSGKSSGYASHVTGMHHVSEKRAYREKDRESKREKSKSLEKKSHKGDSNRKSKKSRDEPAKAPPKSAMRNPGNGRRQHRNTIAPNNPQAFNPASRPPRPRH